MRIDLSVLTLKLMDVVECPIFGGAFSQFVKGMQYHLFFFSANTRVSFNLLDVANEFASGVILQNVIL